MHTRSLYLPAVIGKVCFQAINFLWLQHKHLGLASEEASHMMQRRRRRSGWSGLGCGPLFSGSLVSCPDCRDGLRTRRLGQVSHASSPLPCAYAFLVIVPTLLPADQEPGAARSGCIGTHVLLNTHAYTTCSC